MLPHDFHWRPRYQYANGDNALFVGSNMVAWLDQRIDGSWFARLEVLSGGSGGHRACTSVEQGRAGCEAWACRHEARLRRQSAEHDAKLPMRRWLPQKGSVSS